MANKIDVKLILELLQTPMSQREIIKTRHISSKSITTVYRRAAELGVSYADLTDGVTMRSIFSSFRTSSRNLFRKYS